MEEVKRQGLLQGSTRRPKEPSLQQRATDCLVLEHLQASGYEYSASVFVPESAQSEAKLSAGDALRALQIPPHECLVPVLHHYHSDRPSLRDARWGLPQSTEIEREMAAVTLEVRRLGCLDVFREFSALLFGCFGRFAL